MNTPAAGTIESAISMQAQEEPRITDHKVAELKAAAGADAISPSFIQGYLLGLKTAEVMLIMHGKNT